MCAVRALARCLRRPCHACVAVVIARTELKTRSEKELAVAHNELGCAPKSADHVVTAYDAMDVPDTSMLLMIHTGRRSMKGGLCGSTHEHTQQPCKRLQKTLACCAPGSHFHAVIHETIAGALSHRGGHRMSRVMYQRA